MRSSRRGSVLAGAMAVIFMLMVIAMSMHYYQSMTRQSAMAAEGDLRFREGRRYVLAQQLGTGITPPSGLVITGNVTNDTPGDAAVLADLYAKNIFDRENGLPDLRALGSAPLHAILRLKPFTTDFALMVFGKRTYIDVLSMVPGWAAYAPKGNVTIGDLRGWSNPTYGDPRKSTEAYSGVPAKVYGRKDVNVDFATYGELYTVDGTAKIKNGPGVAYKTKEPVLREYADAFFTQATAARDALVSAAASGDKTASLVSESVGPSSILDLFFGGSSGLEQFLSLRNANHFWMPMIPGFSPYPPYVYEFYFSVPFPPDNASYDVNMAETVSQEIADLQKLLPPAQEAEKKAGEALKKAQNDYNANQTDANLDALKAAQIDYNKKLADLNNIQAQIDSKTAQLNTMVQNGMGSGMQSVPPTRAQDPDGTEGITGWNYSVAGKLLGSLIGFLAFDAKKIADSVSNDDVKLVHFGGKDRLFGFVLDEGHMVLDGTVTVPRGRSLSLRSAGTITVRGDLWLQRGSTLYADCPRLTLETPPGNVGSSSFWTPCGRVFLEEGASLVCTGDVDVPGSLKWGSVVVGGIPGKIHPITTAIIGRNVKLTNGVFSGSALDDLLAEAGKLVPSLASVNNKLLRPLLTEIAPNAAKVLGPFWARKPYFAKYASTFQVIFPPTPFFGVPGPPIPTPIPLPRKNMMVPIARALAYVYSVSLNMSVGENFLTHCDWWIFGEGVVPMVPQIDVKGVVTSIIDLPSTAANSISPETVVKNLVDSVVKTMVTYVVTEVIKKIVAKVALAVIPYGGLAGIVTDLLSSVTDSLAQKEGAVSTSGKDLVGNLTDSVKNAGKSTLDKLQSLLNVDDPDVFMREYNGVMVYGDSITVGGASACGLFLAENNIAITSVRCVGTLLSHSGSITCASLMFYPYFNRASLYLPKATSENWIDRAAELKYDSDFSSSAAIDVGPPQVPKKLTAEGWAK